MKLIDILIENNVEWLDDADGVVQDVDGEVKFYAGEKPRLSNAGVWARDEVVDSYMIIYLQTATDYNTAIVTKQEWENRKMSKEAMFADVKVGDKVWDSRQGWGVVEALIPHSDYPICVDFVNTEDTYTLDGYYTEDDINPSLFWDEIEIKAPPKPVPELEVDTKVIVWQDVDCTPLKRHFSHFDSDGVLCAFAGGRTSHTSCGTTATWDNWKLAK